MIPALHVRPLEAHDRDALAAAFARLSDESRRRRFLGHKPVLTDRELGRLTDLDHRRRDALAAWDEQGRIVAVARYAQAEEAGTAEVAITVADEHQGRGLGRSLLAAVVERAAANGYARLIATTQLDNAAARALLGRLGFRGRAVSGGLVDLELRVTAAAPARAA